ncbi:hypothetical protein J2Y72_005054 [Pseudomonas aeruginosa]|nr:hypothetical protein [Pseudomonas aeruginosa]
MTVPVTPPAQMKSADLERPQDDDEAAGRQVRQQSRPGHADGQADRRDQRRQAGGLDAEETEDAHHQQHVQGHRDERTHVAQHGGIDLLPLEGFLHHADGEADQPTTDHPEGDGRENLDAEGEGVLGHRRPERVDLLGTYVDDRRVIHIAHRAQGRSLAPYENRPWHRKGRLRPLARQRP